MFSSLCGAFCGFAGARNSRHQPAKEGAEARRLHGASLERGAHRPARLARRFQSAQPMRNGAQLVANGAFKAASVCFHFLHFPSANRALSISYAGSCSVKKFMGMLSQTGPLRRGLLVGGNQFYRPWRAPESRPNRIVACSSSLVHCLFSRQRQITENTVNFSAHAALPSFRD
jgi:hypothetical protein